MGWLLAILLGGPGLLWIVGNIYFFLRGHLLREHHSLVPFVGGVLACVGMLLSPIEAVRSFAWVPLLIDPGCSFVLACFVWYTFKGWPK